MAMWMSNTTSGTSNTFTTSATTSTIRTFWDHERDRMVRELIPQRSMMKDLPKSSLPLTGAAKMRNMPLTVNYGQTLLQQLDAEFDHWAGKLHKELFA